jgi:hypothetical protein
MPVEIFYAYAHEDKRLCHKLELHLSNLKRQELITTWHDRDISAGKEWEQEISIHLNKAQIILLLISPDFMASDYCYGIEMKRAMERHYRQEARVIPIILRPVDWKDAPFARLQALPTEAKPVTSWSKYDKALTDIALGIRAIIEELIKQRTINMYIEPEKYGKSAAQGIYELAQRLPEGYDLHLSKREDRIDSTDSFLGIWEEKQQKVFDPKFKPLRQELWGEQANQIEQELIQEMETTKQAIRALMNGNEGSNFVLAPYNADPNTCDVYLEGEFTRVRYNDNTNLGIATNSIRAEVAAGSNMFGRMFQHPKAQVAYIQGLLEINAQSQEQLDKRFVIARTIVLMGPVYLASYAMDHRTNPNEHYMARAQLTSLPKNLQAVHDYFQKLSVIFPSDIS